MPHSNHLWPRSFVPLHDDNTKIWIKFIYGFWVFVKDKIGEHFGQNWKGLRETYGWDVFMQVGWGGLISTFYPQCISFSFTLFPLPPPSFPLYKGQFVIFFFFENLMFDSMFLDCFLKQPLKNEWFKNGWCCFEAIAWIMEYLRRKEKKRKKQIQTLYIPYLYKE